jgi:hypothetical protein
MWQLETTHVRRAQPRVFQERAIRGFGDGFATPGRAYGLPIDHVEVRFVNDHCYGRMVPVGAPQPKPGKVGITSAHRASSPVSDDALAFPWEGANAIAASLSRGPAHALMAVGLEAVARCDIPFSRSGRADAGSGSPASPAATQIASSKARAILRPPRRAISEPMTGTGTR